MCVCSIHLLHVAFHIRRWCEWCCVCSHKLCAPIQCSLVYKNTFYKNIAPPFLTKIKRAAVQNILAHKGKLFIRILFRPETWGRSRKRPILINKGTLYACKCFYNKVYFYNFNKYILTLFRWYKIWTYVASNTQMTYVVSKLRLHQVVWNEAC